MRKLSPILFLVFAVSACGDSSTPDAGAKLRNKDASATDDASADMLDGGGNADATTNPGMDANMPGHDAGFRDSSIHDVGVTPTCDSVANTGCMAPQACVFVQNARAGQCRALAAMPKQLGEACDQTLNNCASGLACLGVNGVGAACVKPCNTAHMDTDCAGLPMIGTSTLGYTCQGLANLPIGACLPKQSSQCSPLHDTCPMGQYCQTNAGALRCNPEGTSARGAACGGGMASSFCTRGNICINLGMGGTCYQPCDPTAAMSGCGMNEVCAGLADPMMHPLPYGVCRANTSCDPLNDMCPMDQNCELTSMTTTGCVPAGMATVGQTCAGACSRGLVCLNVGMGAKCYAPCDMMHACMTGMCQGLMGLSLMICD